MYVKKNPSRLFWKTFLCCVLQVYMDIYIYIAIYRERIKWSNTDVIKTNNNHIVEILSAEKKSLS